MCKRKLFYSLILGLLLIGFLQNAKSEPINIQAGITVYNDPRGGISSYVEFPFSVNRNQFEFVPMDGSDKYKAAISAKLTLSDTLGNNVDSVSTYFYTRVNSLEEAQDANNKLYNVLALYIRPGIYKAVLNVIDVVGNKRGTFAYDNISIEPTQPVDICMSDIELAYDIRIVKNSEYYMPSPLVKNGLEIIPSPIGVFSVSDSNFCFYAELYNLQYPSEASDSMTIIYRIYDDKGALYFDFGEIKNAKPGPTAVLTNVINFSSWKPGKYELHITATDDATGKTAESSHRLVIYPISGSPGFTQTAGYISPLDTADIVTKTHWVRFLLEDKEWTLFETLTDTGKNEYIKRFFDEKDPTPETEKNEYLLDVLSRFQYANENYSTLAHVTNGWQTDRGRVLLKYGLYDEIRESVASPVADPWIIWEYFSLQGGVYFIFEDADRYGNYRLVHSTAKGEIYSTFWAEMIKNNEIEID